MRRLLLALLLCSVMCSLDLRAQPAAIQTTPVAIDRSLTGQWVGTLEYRDYTEPAGSTKRVKLPTWLTVEAADGALHFHYIYDDGPTKVVTEDSQVRIDVAAATYTSTSSVSKQQRYTVSGLNDLKDGRGVLVLTGKATENDAPVEERTTLRIGRNIMEMTTETGPTGQPLAFRHAYTFVRATSPQIPAVR